jgi:hypothetical protein
MTIEQLRENAENCAILAEEAKSEPSRRRYQRMHKAWLALIEAEAWLHGVTASGESVELRPSA